MLGKLRVLVVDDEPEISAMIAEFFRDRGHETATAQNMAEALDELRGRPADLLITDIVYAEGPNGLELARRVREEWPGIAIIVMTAFEEMYPLTEALQAGADGYISKPFTLSKFSLVFEKSYWETLSRPDWWEAHAPAEKNGARR